MEISIETTQHTQFIDITDRVQSALSELPGAKTASAVTIFVPHTTAGITINEHADPDVVADLIAALEKLVPWRASYRHAEGNSAAHVKAALLGSTATVPLQDGRLQLGVWQGIYFCEFDGPRRRQIRICI